MAIVDLIGLCAALCTTLAFLPQVIKVIRTRDTPALSLVMYIVFNIGVALWLCYGILRHDLAITLANVITLSLSLTILTVKIMNEVRSKTDV